MKLSLSKIIFYLFLLLPLSFKIEIEEGISFYPQELLLPFLVIFLFFQQVRSVPRFSYPFLFYLSALFVVLLSTIISQFSFTDISGLLKSVKYILYLFGILLLTNYSFKNFTQKFNTVAFICVSLTILLYLYRILIFEGSFSEFVHLSTWNVNYTPSGFSNLNFNVQALEFVRTTGNHGVYGSYLVLIYIINFVEIFKNTKRNLLFNKLLIALVLVNLLILNSRETLLLFIVVNAFYFIKPILKLKLKLTYLYFTILFLGTISILLAYDVNIGLIQKLNHTIESFSKTGNENNISLRFGVWHLILNSFILFPWFIFIGYGYNTPRFTEYLTLTNNHFNLYETFITVPESAFFFFLAFGGILALVFIAVFFFSIGWETFKIRRSSLVAELLFYFIIGLFLTNNTGGSIMSDLFLAQFALVYIWVHKFYGRNKNIINNS